MTQTLSGRSTSNFLTLVHLKFPDPQPGRGNTNFLLGYRLANSYSCFTDCLINFLSASSYQLCLTGNDNKCGNNLDTTFLRSFNDCPNSLGNSGNKSAACLATPAPITPVPSFLINPFVVIKISKPLRST